MRSIWRVLTALGGALALSACVLGAGDGGKTAAPNPITGGEIEVTALDAPATVKTQKPGNPEAVEETEPAGPPVDRPAIGPKPRPEAVSEAAATDDVPAPEAAPPVSDVEKSAAQLSCERKGDMWAKAGASGASACVKRTRDAGKRCVTGKDCQGECLARSKSCAPYMPLFGCNDVLQDDGVRMTLCLD
jgi:hypothetical protein